MLICARPDVMVSLRNFIASHYPYSQSQTEGPSQLDLNTPCLPFSSPTLLPPHSLLSKMPSSPGYISFSSTHMIHSDLSRKWGPNKHLPSCLTSPDQHMWLLNTCLWEALLLCRFCNFLPYKALGHHPARLLISHALFTYLFVSQAYLAMSQSIPYQWPQD